MAGLVLEDKNGETSSLHILGGNRLGNKVMVSKKGGFPERIEFVQIKHSTCNFCARLSLLENADQMHVGS